MNSAASFFAFLSSLCGRPCQHPADRLAVEREHTVAPIDQDFESVTYHLHCQACGATPSVTHANIIGGVESFTDRARRRYTAIRATGVEHPTVQQVFPRANEGKPL